MLLSIAYKFQKKLWFVANNINDIEESLKIFIQNYYNFESDSIIPKDFVSQLAML